MATSMLTYYVKADSETGYFQAVPQADAAEGLTQIFILPESRDFLLKNWSHYYLDSDGVTKTDDHRMMDIGTDHLIHLNNDLQAALINSNKTITALQKASGQLGGAQAQQSVAMDQASTDVTSLKQIAAQLGGQLAQVQVQLAAIANTDTTTE